MPIKKLSLQFPRKHVTTARGLHLVNNSIAIKRAFHELIPLKDITTCVLNWEDFAINGIRTGIVMVLML